MKTGDLPRAVLLLSPAILALKHCLGHEDATHIGSTSFVRFHCLAPPHFNLKTYLSHKD